MEVREHSHSQVGTFHLLQPSSSYNSCGIRRTVAGPNPADGVSDTSVYTQSMTALEILPKS